MRMSWMRRCALGFVWTIACGDTSGGDGSGAATENVTETSASSDTPSTTNNTTTGPTTSMTTQNESGVTTDDPTGEASGEGSSSTTDLPDDVEVIELRAGGFTPPLGETFYSCFSFTFEVDKLHHIIGFQPVVTNPLIHHYVLSIADGEVQRDPNDSCFEWPASILWAWAPGIEDTMLPPEAGFLIGDAEGGQHTFILQV